MTDDNMTIEYRIKDSIRRLKIVRKSRIYTSERLGNYSSKWEMYLLIMSILSSMLLVVSLAVKDETTSSKIISGCFSMYTIILQYFVSTLNYRERALKFDYHQLEVENMIQDLQFLEIQNQDLTNVQEQYKTIMEKYQILLQGQENHTDLDYKRTSLTDSKYLKDFSLDNCFVNMQPIIIITFMFLYWFFSGGQI
ncbi:SLATT domain-containing protein [Streptococcus uberis]|uniref:SLATT domain-containing protein n=1 Tax=Streptococcus uberis TaxID=1349 RepID=UPI001939DE92|nr:SLATT domain-containing protein [Streptococcus uberis]